jgi:ABC-type cobalamin/Fe3+-siderophores transport system ATPase subunit
MLDVELAVRNYRCFGDEPARIRITDGFTALVGVNNSGKSSLLRLPYEIRPLLNILISNQSNFRDTLLSGGSPGAIWHPQLVPGERAVRAGADRPMEIELTIRNSNSGSFTHADKQLVLVLKYDKGITSSEVRTEDGSVLWGPDATANGRPEPQPVIDAAQALGSAMYIGPFRNAINVGAQGSYYDISTGDAFVSSFQQYKSGDDPAANEAVFQLLEEVRRIFDFKSLQVNPTPDNKTLQMIIDGKSYRLAEQGAGLAHFLIVLVNVLVKRPSLLLIDEPELNLHASLQLDFLTTLGRYAGSGVVFATHSLGLARTAADRIYTLHKPPGGASTVRTYESDKELVTLLGQLSFDRRPGLGFNKVLLVEGKTDLRAIMQLLRLYRKEHEVLLLPLHGDEMIGPDVGQELSEVLRIGANVQYLIDSERSAENATLSKKRQGFVDLCAGLNIRGLVLERRALENYFTLPAISRVYGDSCRALAPYEKKGGQQDWPKAGNWRIAAEMTKADLNKTDLGRFLEAM